MRVRRSNKTAAGLLALCLTAAFATRARGDQSLPQDQIPDGRGIGTILHHGEPGTPETSGGKDNGIKYHGGPVLSGMKNVYYIWYGDWSDKNAVSILSDLAANIGGSPYFNINTTYHDKAGNSVSNEAALAGSVHDSYSRGKTLNDNDVKAVVKSALANGLPADANGVYFVLTSKDVDEKSGFCSQYCGWHDHAAIGGVDIKFAFVGDGERCLSACSAQTASPNGDPGADAMASVVAHELEEAATDPDLNAWYSSRGGENADLCAWNFGAEQALPGGAKYNMTLGQRKFLIQQNWLNADGGRCALSFQ